MLPPNVRSNLLRSILHRRTRGKAWLAGGELAHHNHGQVRARCPWACRYCQTTFMHGLPDETPEDQAATRALMERLTKMGAVVHARIDPATRALLTRLSGTGRQSGKWQAQERTVIATERFLDRGSAQPTP
jgi:hypothetical protein